MAARPISLRLDGDLLDAIDAARGPVSRTEWIRESLRRMAARDNGPVVDPRAPAPGSAATVQMGHGSATATHSEPVPDTWPPEPAPWVEP